MLITYMVGYMKGQVCFYRFDDIPSDTDLHFY